jgi:excisionase family DNA binding protein
MIRARPFCSIPEAAKMLGVSKSFVSLLLDDGHLLALQLYDIILVSVDSIHRFIERGGTK